MHLDDGQIQALLDGEPGGKAAARVDEHLAACPACRDRLDAAARERTDVDVLLGHLDHPAPAVDPAEVLHRAARPHGGARPALARAAGVALALAVAGVAYAAPGSPLPGWLGALGGGSRSAEPARVPDGGEGSGGGVAVAPGDALVVEFLPGSGASSVRVSLGPDPLVTVRSVRGAASFTTRGGRVTVEPSGSSEFEVVIPRDALRVEVRVPGAGALVSEVGRVVGPVAPDEGGRYRISFGPP